MSWWEPLVGIAAGGLLGNIFGDDTETTTQRREIPPASINEQQLLADLMQLYNNPYGSMENAIRALHGENLGVHYDINGNPLRNAKGQLVDPMGNLVEPLDPSTPFGSMVYYYDKMEQAMDIYEALPGKYAEEKEKYTKELDTIARDLGIEKTQFFNTLSGLSEQSSRYTKEYRKGLNEIRQTKGTPVSFGGQYMGEMLPLNRMNIMADLAGKGYEAGTADISTQSGLAGQRFGGAGNIAQFLSGQAGQKYGAAKDVLGAEERMPGYTTALAKDWYDTQRGGAADIWKTMLTARYGIPSTTTEQPGANSIQQMMPMMMYYYGSQNNQRSQGTNPYSGYLNSLWPGY